MNLIVEAWETRTREPYKIFKMLKKIIEMKLAGPLNKEIRADYNWTERYLLFTHSTSTKIGAFPDQEESGKKWSGTKLDTRKKS